MFYQHLKKGRMKKILWLRIVLTGLGVEFLYAIFIKFIRWYEPTVFLNFLALGILMTLGGYFVGRKAKEKRILQGALVGVTGVLFFIFATMHKYLSGEFSIDSIYFLDHLNKIIWGSTGGFIALLQYRNRE